MIERGDPHQDTFRTYLYGLGGYKTIIVAIYSPIIVLIDRERPIKKIKRECIFPEVLHLGLFFFLLLEFLEVNPYGFGGKRSRKEPFYQCRLEISKPQAINLLPHSTRSND